MIFHTVWQWQVQDRDLPMNSWSYLEKTDPMKRFECRGLIQYKDTILPVQEISLSRWDDLVTMLSPQWDSYTGKMAYLYWIRALDCFCFRPFTVPRVLGGGSSRPNKQDSLSEVSWNVSVWHPDISYLWKLTMPAKNNLARQNFSLIEGTTYKSLA